MNVTKGGVTPALKHHAMKANRGTGDKVRYVLETDEVECTTPQDPGSRWARGWVVPSEPKWT
jgi:hypothetical protein